VRCTYTFVVKIEIYLFAWGGVLVELELGVKSLEVFKILVGSVLLVVSCVGCGVDAPTPAPAPGNEDPGDDVGTGVCSIGVVCWTGSRDPVITNPGTSFVAALLHTQNKSWSAQGPPPIK
jgi:hypothetical protein